ncbi:MAG: hypothetical protein Q4B59_03030 [Lachnospiraceae bacterium]|nr:hypothetical protein [Lachnospiraceae bacterium]
MITALIVLCVIFGIGSGVLRLAFKASWGLLKIVLALVAFAICPGLVILTCLLSLFGASIPILLLGGLCWMMFRRK